LTENHLPATILVLTLKQEIDMPRYIVRSGDQAWFVVDTLSAKVIKEYSYEDTALEVAECKNWDEDQEIFAEFA
jgi:hypothetical protein